MATALVIEEERGTCRESVHPHNGYYAGDFGPRAGALLPRRSGSAMATGVVRGQQVLAPVPAYVTHDRVHVVRAVLGVVELD
jgi:hypothetical protein